MIKKIALAAAAAATASFATYNYFPVGEAGSGQVEVGAAYTWYEVAKEDWSAMNINLSGEYVVIPNLELSLQAIALQLWNEPSDLCDEDGVDCDSFGLKALTVGARYWFMPMLGAALDVKVPLNSEETLSAPDYDPFGLFLAVQYSQEFMPGLALGSELGVDWTFEDEDINPGLVLALQAELDYTIANIGLTPWVGFGFGYQLTDTEWGPAEDGAGDNQITFWVGASYDITKMFAVKANFVLGRGDLDGDYQEINAALDVNF